MNASAKRNFTRLKPWSFFSNIFMNDIFYVIELCDLVNYADDNTLSIFASTIEVVLATLKQDTENAIKWFKINFMQVYPSKLQCMFLKPPTNKEEMLKFIEINDTNIPCEKEVNLLGITIDEKLKFDKHVNIICKKAAQQINVMYSFKGVFDLKERQIIYNTFILSNFNYCPIIQHFTEKHVQRKLKLCKKGHYDLCLIIRQVHTVNCQINVITQHSI